MQHLPKKQNISKEKELIKDIEYLERNIECQPHNLNLLSDKKADLEKLIESKIKGEQVRSRIQWLSEGEKPSKTFCNLETKNYIEKSIKKLKLENGDIVYYQKELLHHVKTYYSNLFCNRDKYLNVEKFEKLEGIKKSQPLNKNLGEPLNVTEIGIVLKKMKHNKTPGIDGITAEFLKVFWDKLKMCITNAINCCLTNGEMSITLRQCIIVCLPKGDKDRSLIKNWRPISLLSIFYKLASGTIAERLKTVLDQVISKTQSGFVPGRNISDCTRLIYDLLYLAQDKDYTGLLMLIDFEKAFDSISWKFLYKTLQMFGFSEDFIRWVKLFNTNIKAYILQCGFLSEEIFIERGCR